jgi:amino acid adenylation domain-containing protein
VNISTVDDILKINSLRFPDKTAYQYHNETITYRQLERLSSDLSNFLRGLGVEGNTPVVIFMEKSLEFIISIFGVLKNGSFYVPLNTEEAVNRLSEILDNLGAAVVITKTEHIKKIGQCAVNNINNLKIVLINDIYNKAREIPYPVHTWKPDIDKYPESISKKSHDHESVAYIIYTSGSTGKPKGVIISHQSLLNFIEVTVGMYDFNEQTRIISLKPFYFDASLTDIFCPLYAGGTIIIAGKMDLMPRVLKKIIIAESISHLSLTPVIVKLLADNAVFNPGQFSALKTISFGGESIAAKYIIELQRNLPRVRFINRYGPTETTVAVSAYEIMHNLKRDDIIPIGKPFKNTEFYAVKPDGGFIGTGDIGELYIGGVQVMKGYWNDPALSEKVLINNLISNKVLYKTGDLVTLDRDGNYVFYGRVDDVIKKDGYRINLLEIESAIKKNPDIKDAICLFLPDDDSPQIILVVCVTKNISKTELRKKLLQQIPAYMIPDVIIFMPEIPYTPTGKPDRKRVKNWYRQNKDKTVAPTTI